MNYRHYEAKIVQKHRVVIKGWPLEKFASPNDIGNIPKLEKLRDALLNGTCHWQKISKDEAKRRLKDLKRAEETAPEGRETESDAGGKRKRAADEDSERPGSKRGRSLSPSGGAVEGEDGE